jgi:hypothetical protein
LQITVKGQNRVSSVSIILLDLLEIKFTILQVYCKYILYIFKL